MSGPTISQANVKAAIRLEGKHDFHTILTIGLAEGGDYFLILKFTDLKTDDFRILSSLAKLSRRLSIRSEFFEREGYHITHIVVTSFEASDALTMTWECLSDDPNLYTSPGSNM